MVGRLEKVATPRERRGHRTRARVGERVLDSTLTDGAGRFLLEWSSDGHDDAVVVELVDPAGGVCESATMTAADLTSPPVVVFAGDRVIGTRLQNEASDEGPTFVVEGEYPVCVVSACQPVDLAWSCPADSMVSIFSEGIEVRGSLPDEGLLVLRDDRTRNYTLRTWRSRARDDGFSDKKVEIRRYPSLSLVIDGLTFEPGSEVEFGLSTSCPAGRNGLNVQVRSSDVGMVGDFQIRIPEGSRWATSKSILGFKSGEVNVTAYARGYTRDRIDIQVNQAGPQSKIPK